MRVGTNLCVYICCEFIIIINIVHLWLIIYIDIKLNSFSDHRKVTLRLWTAWGTGSSPCALNCTQLISPPGPDDKHF